MNGIIDALIDNENQEIIDHEQKHDNALIKQITHQGVPNMINQNEDKSNNLSDVNIKIPI